jgi:hypothetical protein
MPAPALYITNFLAYEKAVHLGCHGRALSTKEEEEVSGSVFHFGLSFALGHRRLFFTRNKYLGIGLPGIKRGR